MRLCKDGLNQATYRSKGRAAGDDSDDDWGGWKAVVPTPVEVVEVDDEEGSFDMDDEEVLDSSENWDEEVWEEEGADDGVEVVEVDEDNDDGDDDDDDDDDDDADAKVEASKLGALFAKRFRKSSDEDVLDGLCISLDDQFANRADVCPFNMTHWVPKGEAGLAREQNGTVLKRRRGSSHRAGRVSQVNGYTWLSLTR